MIIGSSNALLWLGGTTCLGLLGSAKEKVRTTFENAAHGCVRAQVMLKNSSHARHYIGGRLQ